jgi:hypothetical protein
MLKIEVTNIPARRTRIVAYMRPVDVDVKEEGSNLLNRRGLGHIQHVVGCERF